MTNNQIRYWEHVEKQRSNRASEAETNRHNLAVESLQYYANQEQVRANKAREGENVRSNVARERENTRANKASEVVRSESNRISAAVQRETAQHNRAMEERDLLNLTQQSYFNTWQASQRETELEQKQQSINQREAELDLEAAKHSETVRHNLETEGNTRASTWANLIGSGISTVGRYLGIVTRTPKFNAIGGRR